MRKGVPLKCLALVYACCATATHLHAQTWSVTSPGGNIETRVSLRSGNVSYSVALHGKEILSAAGMGIMLKADDGDLSAGLRSTGRSDAKIDETYSMPVGKRSTCVHRANETTISFANGKGRAMDLVVRVSDDGMAWRYRLKGQGRAGLLRETSAFHVAEGRASWLQKYRNSYEGYYRRGAGGKPKNAYGFPATFETANGWVLLTEASVYDYVGSRLRGGDRPFGFHVGSAGAEIALPVELPWRVAVIGRSPAALVESTLVQDLNPPCEIKDTSWIRPGATTFPWLTDHHCNKKPERMKQFIDMAAEMGWTWLEFDIPLAFGHPFRGTSSAVWMKAEWIPKLIEYAASRGIRCYGWDHWSNLNTPEKCGKILGWYVKHGVKGIKVDFLNSDSQERFQFRTFISRECAKRKLMLSFHGATVPRGQQRRWPHIATHEGVLGEEWYTFGRTPPTPSA
jgi:alpha-glucosidase